MDNHIVEVGGKFYHPEQFAAPVEWKRCSGKRLVLDGLEEVLIVEGFLSDKLNGQVTLPVDLLIFGTDAEIKQVFKSKNLPSCTRANVKYYFDKWYFE